MLKTMSWVGGSNNMMIVSVGSSFALFCAASVVIEHVVIHATPYWMDIDLICPDQRECGKRVVLIMLSHPDISFRPTHDIGNPFWGSDFKLDIFQSIWLARNAT